MKQSKCGFDHVHCQCSMMPVYIASALPTVQSYLSLEQTSQEACSVSSARRGPEVAQPEIRENFSPYPRVNHHSPYGSPWTCATSRGGISMRRAEWQAAEWHSGTGARIWHTCLHFAPPAQNSSEGEEKRPLGCCSEAPCKVSTLHPL